MPAGPHDNDFVPVKYPYRFFHLERLKGGMDRLLLRSYKTETWPTRIEILFMGVKFMHIGTRFEGLTITESHQIGAIQWKIDYWDGLKRYEVDSSSGSGFVVAYSVSVAESEDDSRAPSRFFMMD